MFSLTACVNRAAKDTKRAASDVTSGIESGVEEFMPDNNRNNNTRNYNNNRNNSEVLPEEPYDNGNNDPYDNNKYNNENNKEKNKENSDKNGHYSKDNEKNTSSKAIDTMSGEFSHLASLDSTPQGWGHGGPIDEKTNRPQSPEAFQTKYKQYNADFIRADDKNLYLTFDEGYENGYTAKILDILKEKKAPAVFFVTYDYAKKNPELIRRMIDEGHIVGNHSYSHPSLPTLPLDKAAEDVKKLHDYIKEEFNYTMTLFRFPMGEFSERDLALLNEMGYKSVFWSFAYKDWDVNSQMNPSEALKSLENSLHSGGIYLLHAVSSTNAEILGDFIDSARAKGLNISPYCK